MPSSPIGQYLLGFAWPGRVKGSPANLPRLGNLCYDPRVSARTFSGAWANLFLTHAVRCRKQGLLEELLAWVQSRIVTPPIYRSTLILEPPSLVPSVCVEFRNRRRGRGIAISYYPQAGSADVLARGRREEGRKLVCLPFRLLQA